MALSKEEISIRLGINAKSVQAGLDSATGYISKWRKKQKTDEEAYTSFWVSEFKKREELAAAELDKRLEVAKAKRTKHAQEVANYEARLAKKAAGGQEYLASLKQKEELEVASAIRAAERSNKARMLWRERAEKREIRAAEEQAKKVAAINDTWANRSYAKAEKKIANIGIGIAAGVAAQASAIITDVITNAVDYVTNKISETVMNSFYGVDSAKTKSVDAQSSYWKEVRSAQTGMMEEKDKFRFDNAARNYEDADNQGKIVLLEKEYDIKMKAHLLAKEDFERTKKISLDEADILKKEAVFYKTLNELSAAGFHLKKQTNELDLDGKAKFAQRKIKELDAKNKEIYEARAEIRAINEEIKFAEGDQKTALESRRLELENVIKGSIADRATYGAMIPDSKEEDLLSKPTGMAAVDDYMSKIKSGQDAYKSKTDYSQFGKAVAEAQKEAATEFVQKVSIVEINEQ